MDWIRLTKSGKDLTGTGGKLIQVTKSELKKHNRRKDAWLALNGMVYNVTPYMDFHPGGWDELGMVSHIMSLITIFGHKHFRQKFHQKFDIFHGKNFNSL